MAPGAGYLHVSFRRQNPTALRRDFVIADGLRGPGRFLGCAVGVRVIDPGTWYGEGEVKIYRDGDGELPTICGTGLEDYAGSAWGLGAHAALYAGAPLVVGPGPAEPGRPAATVDFAGFYRWHVPDPMMFGSDLRVTIQQIGAMFFRPGQEAEMEAYERTNPVAGAGWARNPNTALLAWGITERVDDYCATAYVYCRHPQPVPRLDVDGGAALSRIPAEESPGTRGTLSGTLHRGRPGMGEGVERARGCVERKSGAGVELDISLSHSSLPETNRLENSTADRAPRPTMRYPIRRVATDRSL